MRYANDRLWLPLTLILVVATVSTINAEEDAADKAEQDVVVTKPELPKRDVKFKELDEPLALQLFAADPALLEQKYVATIKLGHSDPPSIAKSAYRDTVSLVARVSNREWLSKVFDYLVERSPENKRPAEDILQLLRSPNYLLPNPTQIRNENRLSFRVIGPDIEQVKVLSLALIELYDTGLWYRAQQDIHARMTKIQELTAEATAGLADAQEKLKPLTRRIQGLEPISTEIISNLKTQQRLTLVDMAAAKARIDACAKILERDDVRGKPIAEEVESIKIAAEIELVGLAARREAVDQIVKEGTQYRELQSESGSRQDEIGNYKMRVGNLSKELRNLHRDQQQFHPLPLLDDGITIQPIKWESGSR